MFKLFKKYYKKDSKKCNLLTTCIHIHDLNMNYGIIKRIS